MIVGDEEVVRAGYHGLLGATAQMQSVYTLLEQVASSDSSVLVLGETGTGKELVARVLHETSPRARGPFVAINCAAIPEPLFEAELFGHERGAFTGAIARRIGHFERASSGTLFLDEVGDLPGSVQVKLLRVLQERELQRVGGSEPVPVDVRLLAATSVDLEQAVRAGKFRADLYYRLNVVPIHLPPLRDRRRDIPLLAAHFLERCAARSGKRDMALSAEALAALEAMAWPGNVRELANVIERAVALTASGGIVSATKLGSLARTDAGTPKQTVERLTLKDAVEQLERAMIVAALREHEGNITRAAMQLGITRQGLSQKMSKYKIATGRESPLHNIRHNP